MELNFSSFKTVKTANVRPEGSNVQRGQNFNLKFRKFLTNKGGKQGEDTSFFIAEKKFTELNLSERALIQVVSPDGVAYIATVDNDKGTMMKRTEKLKEGAEKGKKFKSTILEDALLAKGIIEDKTGVSQMLDINKVGENVEIDGVHVYEVFEIVKGEDTRTEEEKAADEEEADKGTDESGAAPIAETPSAEAAPAGTPGTAATAVSEDF